MMRDKALEQVTAARYITTQQQWKKDTTELPEGYDESPYWMRDE